MDFRYYYFVSDDLQQLMMLSATKFWEITVNVLMNNFVSSQSNYKRTFIHSRAEIAQLVSKFRSGPDRILHMWPQGEHGVARAGTTSDYDRQDYFQILCCSRDIVVTILNLKCQKQKVHGEFGSTES